MHVAELQYGSVITPDEIPPFYVNGDMQSNAQGNNSWLSTEYDKECPGVQTRVETKHDILLLRLRPGIKRKISTRRYSQYRGYRRTSGSIAGDSEDRVMPYV